MSRWEVSHYAACLASPSLLVAGQGREVTQCGSATAPLYSCPPPHTNTPLRSQQSWGWGQAGSAPDGMPAGLLCLDSLSILQIHNILAWPKSTSGVPGGGRSKRPASLASVASRVFQLHQWLTSPGGPPPALLASDLLRLLGTLPEVPLVTCGLSQKFQALPEPVDCSPQPCKEWPLSGKLWLCLLPLPIPPPGRSSVQAFVCSWGRPC